jgi:flagellar hook-associated protein 3 FlgL
MMLGSMLTADLQSVQTQMLQVQQELSSGHRIIQPSNDPVGTQNVLVWQNAIDQNAQYQRNAQNAVGWLQSTDSALQSAIGLVQQVRTLAVSTSAGTLTTAEYQAISDQVTSLLNSLVAVANTKMGDHYLFNGDQTTIAPFTQSGTSVTFDGTSGNQMREVFPGQSVQANIGGSVFSSAFSAISTMLGYLASPSTAAQVTQTVGGTASALQLLDAALNGLINADGQAGAQLEQAQNAQSLLTNLGQSLQQLQAGTLDANLPKTVVSLQELQVSYQSALAVGAKLIQPTLANYLP